MKKILLTGCTLGLLLGAQAYAIPPKGLNLEFPMTSELKAIIAKPVSDPVE
jgi:hypothetical protein